MALYDASKYPQGYDPRLSALISEADKDWGDPGVNAAQVVKYNIGPEFDRAMWGIDLIDGELITIQAPKKQRKSTLLANLVLNFSGQLIVKNKWCAIDTLESGMTPKAYRDILASIIATRIMIARVYGNNRENWPAVDKIVGNEIFAQQSPLNITRKFLRFGFRGHFQHQAIEQAKILMADIPLSIFGSAKAQGEARDITKTIERWSQLYDGAYSGLESCHHVIFCTDNVQQYREFAGNSYYGLEVITNHLSTFVTSHPGAVVIAVSQVSLGSQRSAQSGEGEMEVRGGTRLAEESVTVFQTRYDKLTPTKLTIETPFSRYEPPPTVVQDIEPNSGAFLAPARPLYTKVK